MFLCHPPGIAFDGTANGYGDEASDLSKSGFPMSMRLSSFAKRTANPHSSPPANTTSMTRHSSTRFRPTGTTPPNVRPGDIYTAAARGTYTGKPRLVVVVQDDRFDATASVTVVPFTTSDVEAPLLRLPVQPSNTAGLTQISQLMIDKVTTVPRASLRQQIGRLSDGDLMRLNRALLVFLGLAG